MSIHIIRALLPAVLSRGYCSLFFFFLLLGPSLALPFFFRSPCSCCAFNTIRVLSTNRRSSFISDHWSLWGPSLAYSSCLTCQWLSPNKTSCCLCTHRGTYRHISSIHHPIHRVTLSVFMLITSTWGSGTKLSLTFVWRSFHGFWAHGIVPWRWLICSLSTNMSRLCSQRDLPSARHIWPFCRYLEVSRKR